MRRSSPQKEYPLATHRDFLGIIAIVDALVLPELEQIGQCDTYIILGQSIWVWLLIAAGKALIYFSLLSTLITYYVSVVTKTHAQISIPFSLTITAILIVVIGWFTVSILDWGLKAECADNVRGSPDWTNLSMRETQMVYIGFAIIQAMFICLFPIFIVYEISRKSLRRMIQHRKPSSQ
jgi:hypothetical protein